MPRRKGLYPKYLTVVVSQKRHDEIKARAAAREESMGSYVRTLLREGKHESRCAARNGRR